MRLSTFALVCSIGVATPAFAYELTGSMYRLSSYPSGVPYCPKVNALAAKPDGWKDEYIPADRCCDRIEYTMTLEQKGGERTIRWIDDPLPMPEDLVALTRALMGGEESVRVRYGGQCH